MQPEFMSAFHTLVSVLYRTLQANVRGINVINQCWHLILGMKSVWHYSIPLFLISSFSSQWSPPIRSNFSNVYADNITSTGFRLNSTLPNNISLVYEIELLPNDTWKDVNCRKLFLSRNGAKISIRLENLDASSYFWQVPQPAFYLRVLFKTNVRHFPSNSTSRDNHVITHCTDVFFTRSIPTRIY